MTAADAPRSRREARQLSGVAEVAQTTEPTAEAKPRRGRRAGAAETDENAVDETPAKPVVTPSVETPAKPVATPSAETPAKPAPMPSVAASTVAAPRPHAARAGRRAAEVFTDEVEKPVGGRRARAARAATNDVPAESTEVTLSTAPISIEAAVLPADLVTTVFDAPGAAAPTPAAPLPVEKTAKPATGAVVSRRTLRGAARAVVPENEAGADNSQAPGHAAAAAPSGRRGKRANLGKGAFSVIAMIFATGIAVATTMPATALHSASASSLQAETGVAASVAPAQELTTGAETLASSISRDGYGVRDVAALRAAGYRIADTFTNNPSSPVQWPFPIGVPISDGFGHRESPGGIGSTDHKGVDFTPGQGTPIQIIADGVVSKVVRTDSGGLGVYAIVDHVIDGQKVSSVYGHMLTGSIEVEEGQVVKVAQTVGRVGNTGTSTGAHLHFEVRLDGVTPVDPMAWLQENVA